MKTENQCKNKLVMNAEKEKYKWLVVAMVFLSQALTYGITYSVGVFYKEWTRYFDATASFLSLVGSAPTAISCLLGPVYGYLLNRFSFRQCGLVGGLLMAVGMCASSLVENAMQIFFTFGVMTGFGLGLHYYVACTMVNEYFVEDRVLAEGVIGGGIGLGTFVFSIFQQYLSNHFTWRGAILISGGIVFHLCLNSMFFVPSLSISLHPLNFWKQNSAKCSTENTKHVKPEKSNRYEVELKEG